MGKAVFEAMNSQENTDSSFKHSIEFILPGSTVGNFLTDANKFLLEPGSMYVLHQSVKQFSTVEPGSMNFAETRMFKVNFIVSLIQNK